MKRRELIGGLAGAVAWPFVARAQQPAPLVGCIHSGAAASSTDQFAALYRGLNGIGYHEGQNITIEYRWADDQYTRLPIFASEFVRRGVKLLLAAGGPVSALAAKAATETIPIVFTAVADPVGYGLVTALNRPGGNVTGTAGLTTELDAKRLELLRDLIPAASTIGVLVNPNRPGIARQLNELQEQSGRQSLVILRAGTESELETAFSTLAERPISFLVITADPFFNNKRAHVVTLLQRYAVPAIDQRRDFANAGGLMSYGPNLSDAYYGAGVYVGRILKGENAADLPVLQPTKFDLAINLKPRRRSASTCLHPSSPVPTR